MSFAVLWVESLLASSLLAAALITLSLRRKKRWAAAIGCVFGILLPLFPTGWLAAGAAWMLFMGLRTAALWWAVILFSTCLAATIAILTLAMKRNPAGIRRAVSWPLPRLATAWLVVLSLITMTLWNLGLQAQLEVQTLRTEVGALALSVLPLQVPDSANAAPLYEQANEQFKAAATPADLKFNYLRPDPGEPRPADFLQRQQKTLEILRRAADMPVCRFDNAEHDFLPVFDQNSLHQLQWFRIRANLLVAAAKGETTNVDLALADCRRMYAVAAHASSPPMLVTGMVTIAIDARASKTVAEVLPRVTNADQLDRFPIPDPSALSRNFVHLLRGEEAFRLAGFCDLASGRFSIDGPPWEISSATGSTLWILWLRSDIAVDRALQPQLRQIARQPYYQSRAARQKLDDEFRQPGHGVFTPAVKSQFLDPFSHVAEAQALRSSVAVAVAATRYRLAHHDYPAAAADLVPAYLDAIPLDPFDGQPLRYKKTPAGELLIYSVGPDLIDNAGDIQPTTANNHRPPDIGLLLQLPPRAPLTTAP